MWKQTGVMYSAEVVKKESSSQVRICRVHYTVNRNTRRSMILWHSDVTNISTYWVQASTVYYPVVSWHCRSYVQCPNRSVKSAVRSNRPAQWFRIHAKQPVLILAMSCHYHEVHKEDQWQMVNLHFLDLIVHLQGQALHCAVYYIGWHSGGCSTCITNVWLTYVKG
jgi:hypothetical protein